MIFALNATVGMQSALASSSRRSFSITRSESERWCKLHDMPDADVRHVLEVSCAGFLLALSMYTCACVRLLVATICVVKTSVEKGVVRLCGSVAEHLSCKQKVPGSIPGGGMRHSAATVPVWVQLMPTPPESSACCFDFIWTICHPGDIEADRT